MPVYEYQALDARGKKRRGVISADSLEPARTRLREMGLFPSRLVETAARETAPGTDRRLFRGRFFQARPSRAELAALLRQLANLLEAGIPLMKTLSLLMDQRRSRAMSRVLARIQERLKAGVSFSQALREQPEVFPPLYAGLAAASEFTGTLDAAAEALAEHAEHQLALRRRLIGALAYPCLLLAVGLGVMLLLLTLVVPQLAKIFTDLKQELPLATVILIRIGDVCRDFWPLILAGAALPWPLLVLAGRRPGGRRLLDRLLLGLPLAGGLVRDLAAARFARTVGMVARHGGAILPALEIARGVVGNAVFEEALGAMHAAVGQGTSLSRAMEASGLFPELAVQMAAAGESSGTLDAMLLKTADILEGELAARLTVLAALAEPVMILVMGAAVGAVALAVLLPLFEIGGLIG